MSRVKTIEVVGATLTQTVSGGSVTVIGGIKSLSGGGYSRASIDDTDLSNAAVMTKVPAALKECKDLSFTLKAGATAPAEGNSLFNLYVGGMTLSFYGFVSELEGFSGGDIGSGLEQTITITPTNLNDSDVETAPVLTIG